jgi:hypothetical protein
VVARSCLAGTPFAEDALIGGGTNHTVVLSAEMTGVKGMPIERSPGDSGTQDMWILGHISSIFHILFEVVIDFRVALSTISGDSSSTFQITVFLMCTSLTIQRPLWEHAPSARI